MVALLRAELSKLFTIRSTYAWSIAGFLLAGFIGGYAMGYKNAATFGPDGLNSALLTAVSVAGIFAGIVAILLICHEYRYNTIAYTLTISNRRIKVLFAKLVAVSIFGIIFTLFALAIVACATLAGVHIAGYTPAPQDISFYSVAWKTTAFIVGSTWMGLLFGFLFRSQVFSIVFYFMLPTTIEPVLHGLLKVNSNYLPDMLQNQIVATNQVPGQYSPLTSLGVFAAYLVGGWIVAAVLFVKRDAN